MEIIFDDGSDGLIGNPGNIPPALLMYGAILTHGYIE